MSELVSSASSWVIGDRERTLATLSSGRGSSMATGATFLEVGLPFGPSLRVGLGRGGAASVHLMGGGPRTFPGGISKWQWKRMQLKKSRQIEKARLLREKHICEARRRAELQAATPVLEMPWQKLSRVQPPNYITADEQITNLASRFQRRGGEDLWTEKDGPERFEVMEDHMPAQFSDIKAPNQGCLDIDASKIGVINQTGKLERQRSCSANVILSASLNVIAIPCFLGAAHADVYDHQIRQIYGDLGAGLEIGLQVLYLAALLCLIGVGSYFVVRQVLIRRDLESAARDLQDRVRTGQALPVEYFELGAVMLRKRFFTLASRYLEQAIDKWDGDPQDLAQVHNALGFSYVNDNNMDEGIEEYEKAVKLQPGYVVAWNNLGSAYEKRKDLTKALNAYEQALKVDPNNPTAKEYRDSLKERVKRLKGVSLK